MTERLLRLLHCCSSAASWKSIGRSIRLALNSRLSFHVGRCPAGTAGTAVIFFPFKAATLHCGLAGLVSVARQRPLEPLRHLDALSGLVQTVETLPLEAIIESADQSETQWSRSAETIDNLYAATRDLQRQAHFVALLENPNLQAQLQQLHRQLESAIAAETRTLEKKMGQLTAAAGEAADQRIVGLKDAAWCMKTEILDNIEKTLRLMPPVETPAMGVQIKIYRNINAVLNSIDRLEVRGRDSAGISLLFILEDGTFGQLESELAADGLSDTFKERGGHPILGNGSISVDDNCGDGLTGLTLTYKVAAEVGSLGDNVRQLRERIQSDTVLYKISRLPHRFHTVSAHTRWASVGAISIANCHPVDNAASEPSEHRMGIIHACLNGDIDNYLELRKEWEAKGESIPKDITTDTKIIPLQVEKYLRRGHPVAEAFRLAVNDFDGSHAIAMHTDLAPGKFFLAQRGSGQAVFVGIAPDHYMPTSEVYGFIEETSQFVKMDGEKIVDGANGPTQGQLFVLDQESSGGLEGITGCYYDGTPITLNDENLQRTEITSRDIDRQNFSHYFLKEISEAPLSVSKTLQNRWKIDPDHPSRTTIALDEAAFPQKITAALAENSIQRIYFIGQGTAGVAAQANADILNTYLREPSLKISALKASELSGFQLGEDDGPTRMSDTLVIAISQSGTTTDTNRTVDMVRSRGAHTMAIVNRRDSDITFKVDGVVYTSSGRDIEMSVASTKAFYSQIVAGALVSLKIAQIRGRRDSRFITEEIKSLRQLPDQMSAVLKLSAQIKQSAQRLAPSKTYWAAVGSGPNKAAADEIRIKLSELCYKTISSDYVEDKKHIDLSSEPLILICAAGTTETVIGDIIKDTAIFKAHKAAPVVIVDQGEERFAPYAEDVFHVPAVQPHLAPILNTLAGHLWGYHAALAINDGSRFLYDFREEINTTLNRFADDGLDVYEVILEKTFREKIAAFYKRFRQRQSAGGLPTTISHTADLLLLLKYLSGRLPVSDFELDFGKKGTALNMLNSLFEFLGKSINGMSRPVDAIKHQAKTVTVGTSRITEKTEGILFDALADHAILNAQLINRNVLVLKNLQGVVGAIHGSILYRIGNLDLLGEPTDETTIEILRKQGVLEAIPSRVETDRVLKGTKRIIVRQGNVYIGKGRKDDRSIIVIPAISSNPDESNRIDRLLLLNIGFQENTPLGAKIKALGGKYEHIKNIVQENNIPWDDALLETVAMDELFGRSAEKIGDYIVNQNKGGRD
jgi:glucosamine--fructose-6-phosphate aminotransferase (isomerizing)